MIVFACPKCSCPVHVSPGMAGGRVGCPTCRALVVVPDADPRPARFAITLFRSVMWAGCVLWTAYWLVQLLGLLAHPPGQETAAGVAFIVGSVTVCGPIVGGYVVCRALDALLLIARGD